MCCKEEERKEEKAQNLLGFTEMNAYEDGLRLKRRARRSPQSLRVIYENEDADETELSTDAEFFTVAYDLESVALGQDVEARYTGTKMWYGGKLEKIHKNKTADIKYEDKDYEADVSLERIRLSGYYPERRKNVGTMRCLKDRLEMHADELQVTYLLNMLIQKSILPST